MRKAAWIVIAALVMGALVATPAVAQENQRRSGFGFLRRDSADSCRDWREPLTAARNYVRNQTIRGAVTGAVVGGILGAATGNDDNRGDRAAVGAAVGALAGGAQAYVNAKRQQGVTADQLRSAIDNDLQLELTAYSPTATAVQQLSECRRGQIADVSARLEQGVITREQAAEEATLLERRIAQDDELISAVAQMQTSRVATYVEAHSLAAARPQAELLGDVAAYEPQFEVVAPPPTPATPPPEDVSSPPAASPPAPQRTPQSAPADGARTTTAAATAPATGGARVIQTSSVRPRTDRPLIQQAVISSRDFEASSRAQRTATTADLAELRARTQRV